MKIKVDDILVESKQRFRQDFTAAKLANLAGSISYHGLWHPIHVKELDDAEKQATGKHWKLVHGERRLRAIRDYLWPTGGTLLHNLEVFEEGYVPATLTDTQDSLKLLEAEFGENEDREPFTWQERADATARLAYLRREQSKAAGNSLPTVADIALETKGRSDGNFQETTRREIAVASHLADPEVGGAKTLDEAWKALKRREEAAKHAEHARNVGRTFTASVHTVVNADCLEWMQGQDGDQFDVICTDPPYGIDAQDFGDAGGRLQRQTHNYDDGYSVWEKLLFAAVPEWFRLAKPQAHLYVCCDIENYIELREWVRKAGWRPHRTPIINYKTDGNRIPWPTQGPQRKWEMILYAIKGDKPTTGVFPDIMLTKGDENFGHGAQKPVAMYQDLLRRSVRPGDVILDPFGGTGTLIPAAHSFKCRAVVVEKETVAYGIALKRLETLKEIVK